MAGFNLHYISLVKREFFEFYWTITKEYQWIMMLILFYFFFCENFCWICFYFGKILLMKWRKFRFVIIFFVEFCLLWSTCNDNRASKINLKKLHSLKYVNLPKGIPKNFSRKTTLKIRLRLTKISSIMCILEHENSLDIKIG